MRLLYSARTPADVLGRTVLGPETMITLTRQVPGDWQEQTGRINADMQTRRAFRPTEQPWIFACGATRRNLDRVDGFAGQDASKAVVNWPARSRTRNRWWRRGRRGPSVDCELVGWSRLRLGGWPFRGCANSGCDFQAKKT
jgi:hypothetical protein